VDAPQAAGRHELAWSGRDEGGALVAPGTYFARLFAGDGQAAARVTIRR
jgi:hypothetical protein